MYVWAWRIQPEEYPWNELNEILYIEKMPLPSLSSLSCVLLPELISQPNG